MSMSTPSSSKSSSSSPVDPNTRYPNPSFGLEIWGPLVPANDCKSCLYTLAGIQMATGLFMWWAPGRTNAARLAVTQAAHLPVTARTVWKHRLFRATGIFTGSYLMFLSGLELIRLQLTRDPWAEDAAAARKAAEAKVGPDKVSWWFGPRGYRAVEYKEWKRRVDAALERGEVLTQHKWTVVRDVHGELKERNRELARKILDHGLDEPLSLHPAPHPVFSESAQPIEKTETEEETEKKKEKTDVADWIPMDPWRDLRDEMDVQIRIIPHTPLFDNTAAANERRAHSADKESEVMSVVLTLDEDAVNSS